MKRVWLGERRLDVTKYDQHGEGYLLEEWLESYIRDLIPTLIHLEGLDPKLKTFYIQAATRKFFFFLDPQRIGKLRIVDLLASKLLNEVSALRDLSPDIVSNWFSKEWMIRVHEHYILLDKDANGSLSPKEFMRFNLSSKEGAPIRLTRAFVNQLFNQIMTFRGEMDFRSFVDFVLAMENCEEEVSIAYFFRVLDLNSKGYLNAFDLNYFYKNVFKMLPKKGAPRFSDVKDEIFDMVKPEDPLKITLKDLCKCGNGDLVLGMLINVNRFIEYENRMEYDPNNSTLVASTASL